MKSKSAKESHPIHVLREFALTYPEAQAGIACAGTAVETPTVTVKNKSFVFLGATGARVKLLDSLAEASKLAGEDPSCYEVGIHGWVKVTFRNDQSVPVELLKKWIDESYRQMAPKQLVALLPERGLPAVTSPRPAKVSASKKRSMKKS